MDVFEEQCYYKCNRFLLSVIGLWPFLDVKTRRIRISFVSVSLMIILFLQFAKVLTSEWNLNLFIEILTNFILTLCVSLIFVTACINEKKSKKLIEQIRSDWTLLRSEEECKIFKQYAKESRLCTFILLTIFFGCINIICFLTLLPVLLDIVAPLKESRIYEIPFPIETFYDTTKHFNITILLMYFLLNIMGCVSIGLYGFLLMILQHCSGLFELVGLKIYPLYILENSIEDKEFFTDKENKKILKKIVRGIWFHKRTIKFIGIINSICQNCYLIQIIFLGILINVDILRILHTQLTIENSKEILTSIMHIIGNLAWAFLNCYLGQRVLDRSSEVHTKICNARWYLSSTKIKKLILLIITRSLRPSYVMIGGTFISSMELFASITQSSVSYAMVFYSL